MSVVAIAILDDHDRLCTHSTVTLVAADALARELSVEVQPDAPEGQASLADGKRWPQPKGMEIPLIDTFEPTAVGGQGHETTTATRVIWQEANTSAEACCIAADISVGPPVARAVRGAASTPNPDLSLRFLSVAEPGDYLAAQCRLAGIVAGVATTRINVWQGGELLAIGISTTTCLPMAR